MRCMVMTIKPIIKPLKWFSLIQLENLARNHERDLEYNYSHWHKSAPDKVEAAQHDISLYRAEIARRFPNWIGREQRLWAARQAREAAK